MRILIVMASLFFPLYLAAQQTVSSGFFPEAQLSHKIKSVQLTAKIESQHGMVDAGKELPTEYGYYHDRTDFQGFVGSSFNPFVKWDVGYQYRWDGDGNHNHRAIQQIAWVQKKVGYRLAHRVRADQTYASGEVPLYRIRYRLSLELPLSGTQIDPGEFYLVLSDEPIYGYQNGTSTLENRLVGSLGHYFSKNQKVEAGIDHRIDRFLKGGSRQRFWLKVGWYVSI